MQLATDMLLGETAKPSCEDTIVCDFILDLLCFLFAANTDTPVCNANLLMEAFSGAFLIVILR
jgi:hypothetical protein